MDRQRFPREGGLIDAEGMKVEEAHVRRNFVSALQGNDVARYQARRIDAVRTPRTDGLGPGFHGLGKGFDGGQRLVLLDEANRRVDQHHTEDKDRLDILLQDESDGAA